MSYRLRSGLERKAEGRHVEARISISNGMKSALTLQLLPFGLHRLESHRLTD